MVVKKTMHQWEAGQRDAMHPFGVVPRRLKDIYTAQYAPSLRLNTFL